MRDILFREPDFVFSYRVGGVLIHDGRVLLQRPDDDDGYAVIGGHVAALETAEAALRREYLEELRAPVSVGPLLAVGENFFPWGNRPCHQLHLYFAVTLEDEAASPLQGTFHGYDDLGGERIGLNYTWVPLADLPRTRVYPPQLAERILRGGEAVSHFTYHEGTKEANPMILETERLILRKMTQEDYPALCRMLQDPLCMYAYEHAFSDEEAQAWLDRQQTRYREDGFGLWAMVRKDTGEMIGQCGLTWQDAGGERVLEVGYLLQRAHWHQGYATEAAVACRDYAFNVLHAPEVYSIIRDTNAASQGVARRNGMTPCKAFIKHYYNMDMPHLLFRVRREEVVSPAP